MKRVINYGDIVGIQGLIKLILKENEVVSLAQAADRGKVEFSRRARLETGKGKQPRWKVGPSLDVKNIKLIIETK